MLDSWGCEKNIMQLFNIKNVKNRAKETLILGLTAACPKTGMKAIKETTLANRSKNWNKTVSFNKDNKASIYI